MKRYIVILVMLFLLITLDTVHAAFLTSNAHPGYRICNTCHEKRTGREDITIQNVCQKKCHYGDSDESDEEGEDYIEGFWPDLHNKPNICKYCHTQINGTFQIHDIHVRNTDLDVNVQCKICHQSPEGFNSTLVNVPPTEEVTKPKWNGSCFYCHKTRSGGSRLHDFHQPVLLKNGTCQKCHGDQLKPGREMIKRIAGEYPPWLSDKKIESVGDVQGVGDVGKLITASVFYDETLKFFDEIASVVNAIFNTFKKEVLT